MTLSFALAEKIQTHDLFNIIRRVFFYSHLHYYSLVIILRERYTVLRETGLEVLVLGVFLATDLDDLLAGDVGLGRLRVFLLALI